MEANRSGQVIIPPETMAALLLVGSDKAAPGHSRSRGRIDDLLNETTVLGLIKSSAHGSTLRPLLEAWGAVWDTTVSVCGMTTALKYELRETSLQLARRWLGEEGGSWAQRCYAAPRPWGGSAERKMFCESDEIQSLLSLGFIENAKREAAHAKWAADSTSHEPRLACG